MVSVLERDRGSGDSRADDRYRKILSEIQCFHWQLTIEQGHAPDIYMACSSLCWGRPSRKKLSGDAVVEGF
jgi:hypothetical protein